MSMPPYLGEIRIFACNYAPTGWALCNGQHLSIKEPLFGLYGTTFGGDGTTDFALPDLRGRVPMHVGHGFLQGQSGGEETHSLVLAELPAHNHPMPAAMAHATQSTGASDSILAITTSNIYATGLPVQLAPESVSMEGGGAEHENMQPFLVLNFCVAIQGRSPSST